MATGGSDYDYATTEDTAQIHLDHGSFPATSSRENTPIVTEDTGSGVAKHDVSFQSLTGVIFLAVLGGFLLCIASFSSVAWSKFSEDASLKQMQGLWETCECNDSVPDEDWFRATQAMICIGLIGYFITLMFLLLYMCSCLTCCTKTTLLIMVMGSSFVTALFLFIGQVVFGASETKDLAWAFMVSFASTIIAIIAGSITVMQYFRVKKQ